MSVLNMLLLQLSQRANSVVKARRYKPSSPMLKVKPHDGGEPFCASTQQFTRVKGGRSLKKTPGLHSTVYFEGQRPCMVVSNSSS